MEISIESAHVFYIDGHVRVYHGDQTVLPRHYVARQKLCLRATVDYWVNAMDGQPFFLVNQAVDPGLLQVMEHDIVPNLERYLFNESKINVHDINTGKDYFTLVFDREGYSPAFFLKMKEKKIACLTYHKYPGEDWPLNEFISVDVTLKSGQTVKMELAERQIFLSKKIWVREIRKLNESKRQTSILTTDYCSDKQQLAAAMFARWSQENYLKYMREHYNLDRLIDYGLENIPDTTKVVNPEYRRFDGQVRSKVGILTRKKANFGALNLTNEIEPRYIEEFARKKQQFREK